MKMLMSALGIILVVYSVGIGAISCMELRTAGVNCEEIMINALKSMAKFLSPFCRVGVK
jgi:hypothetical protein